MGIGRFYGMVGALLWRPADGRYLVLRRSNEGRSLRRLFPLRPCVKSGILGRGVNWRGTIPGHR